VFKGNNQNPESKVLPSYHFWATWIGHKTRSSNEVLNTEFRKIKTPKVSEESQVYHVTEDRLMEEFMNQKVFVLYNVFQICFCLVSHAFVWGHIKMYFPNPTLIRLMLFVNCARNVVWTQLDQNWTSFHACIVKCKHSTATTRFSGKYGVHQVSVLISFNNVVWDCSKWY